MSVFNFLLLLVSCAILFVFLFSCVDDASAARSYTAERVSAERVKDMTETIKKEMAAASVSAAPAPAPEATVSEITSMMEFVFKQSDNEVVGSGRNQMLVSHTSPLVVALNDHLISLDSTRYLHLYRNGPFSIASRDEIVVDPAQEIFARVLPLGSSPAVDQLRLWVEKRQDIKDEKDLPRATGTVGTQESCDCIIFLYSTKLKLGDLKLFVENIFEKDMQRKNDQLGNQLFYFKEVGSAMMAAEQQSIRALANQQLQTQLLTSAGPGGNPISSAEGAIGALKNKTFGNQMLQTHMGQLAGAGSGGQLNYRPFMFMMTPFRTNKRIENLAGAIFRKIEKRIRDFSLNKDWWIKRGQPHTYGLLIKGPPGCGKTSLTKAIAKSTNRNIFDLNLHGGVTQRQLFDFFHEDTIFVQPRFNGMILDGGRRSQDSTYRIPMSRRLLVFDDFTAGTNIFEDRESDTAMLNSGGNSFNSTITNGNDPLTLQFVLNLFDGVLENQDRISIFCDNYGNIDRAMLRPGRIDDIIELGYLTLEGTLDFVLLFFEIPEGSAAASSIRKMFDAYRDDGNPFEEKVLTPAELNRILMTNKEESLEKVVHEIIGESIRFRDYYANINDSYYKRIREKQDMDAMFPSMVDDEAAPVAVAAAEGVAAAAAVPAAPAVAAAEGMTTSVEIHEKQVEEVKPVAPKETTVAVTVVEEEKEGKMEEAPPAVVSAYDARREYRRRHMKEMEEERKRQEEERRAEEEKRMAEFHEQRKREDEEREQRLKQIIQETNQEAKGIDQFFQRNKVLTFGAPPPLSATPAPPTTTNEKEEEEEEQPKKEMPEHWRSAKIGMPRLEVPLKRKHKEGSSDDHNEGEEQEANEQPTMNVDL